MTWTLSAFADEADQSIDTQIKALHEAGIAYIDPRSVDGINISELQPDHAQKVADKLNAGNIKVSMLGSPLGKIDIADDLETDLAKLRNMAAIKDILGCNAVRIFSYYNREKVSADQWQTKSLDYLKRLRDLASQTGMVLYHENEAGIFGEKLDGNLILAEQLRDGDTFRLIFDFDNYNHAGDDVWEDWTKLRDVTDAIHLKDSDENHQHVPAGQGAGKISEILTDAVARGWTGPLTLEPHLAHSKAVMATGPSGQANAQFANLTEYECFQVAAKTAKDLLSNVGASIQ